MRREPRRHRSGPAGRIQRHRSILKLVSVCKRLAPKRTVEWDGLHRTARMTSPAGATSCKVRRRTWVGGVMYAGRGCDGPIRDLAGIWQGIGRSGEIRTPDPLLPKQVRYQAALRSARPSARRDSARTRLAADCVGRGRLYSPRGERPQARSRLRGTGAGRRLNDRFGRHIRAQSCWDCSPEYDRLYGGGPPRQRGQFALGRSQVVRQRALNPPCGGSNPPAPANVSGT